MTFNGMGFYGMPVHVNDSLGWNHEVKQVRFPRSKKRRIRKKFTKDRRNYAVRKWQEPVAFQGPGCFIVNEPMLKALRQHSC